MTLTDKLQALLAIKQSLLETASLPENLRGYNIQNQIMDCDKQLLDLMKQIMEAKATELNKHDDIPF